MGNTDGVRFPGVQFEFTLHNTQGLIDHSQRSMSGFRWMQDAGKEKKARGSGAFGRLVEN